MNNWDLNKSVSGAMPQLYPSIRRSFDICVSDKINDNMRDELETIFNKFSEIESNIANSMGSEL